MPPKDAERQLSELHKELAKTLLKRVKDGTATAADLSVARQFLKDNGIEAVPREGKPLGELAKNLPQFGPDDLDDQDLRH